MKKNTSALLPRLGLALLVILVFYISVTALLAARSLIKPGSFLFPLQDSAEQTGVSLNGDALARARLQMSLLDRRTADLRTIGGQAALEQVNIAFDRTLLALAQLPSTTRQTLRTELLALFNRLQSALETAPGLAGNPAAQVFAAKLAEARRLVDSGPPTALDLTALARIRLNTPLQQGGTINPSAAAGQNTSYGHPAFPLTGAHADVACTTCHALPHTAPYQCDSCHAERRPTPHFAGDCSQCHTPTAWANTAFNHTAAVTDCVSCHAQVRPANHYTGQCSLCHTVGTTWLPAKFNHTAANATDCQTCHAAKRPANHYTGQCSLCHTVGTAWKPATVNHAAAKLTDCLSCHAARRPANHYAGQCSQCHTTSAWRPATFNHAAAGATNCQGCHAARRPANHYTGQCSLCHTTTAWKPANFNHKFPINHNGANGQCATCHPGTPPAYTCFNCHNQTEITKKHAEENITNISNCAGCHPTGRKP